MNVRGKQLLDDAIEQKHLNITRISIVNPNDATNKQYVEEKIGESQGVFEQASLNNFMTANVATVGQKTCSLAVIEFPISNVLVSVNGIMSSVGEGLHCYFSPDGSIIRSGGTAQKGDYLYWNLSNYDLDSGDTITFNYLVNYNHFTYGSGDFATVNPLYNNIVIKYTGSTNTNMTVSISGNTYLAGNVDGSFVWDIGGSDEYTFTYTNEYYVFLVDNEPFTVWFDGFGSLVFSISKEGTAPIQQFNIRYGFSTSNNYIYDMSGTSSGYLMAGSFTDYYRQIPTRLARLNIGGTIDDTFNTGLGASSIVNSYIEQPDNKIILVGSFTLFNGISNTYLSRINANGSLDTGFTIGTAFNNITYSVGLQSDNKIIVGGDFTSYNSVSSYGVTTSYKIIKLNTDGTVNTNLNVGSGLGAGTNYIYSYTEEPNGNIIMGGRFSAYNGITRYGLARISSGGTLDSTFNDGGGIGTSDYIYSIVRQPDGKILVGGSFTTYSGITTYGATSINKLLKINTDGSINTGFTINGAGFTSIVYIQTVKEQVDGKLLIGGRFTSTTGSTTKYGIVRLNSDGTYDFTFNSGGTGIGTTDYVYTIDLQSDNKILIGGNFTAYNGLSSYGATTSNRIIKLYPNGDIFTGFTIGAGLNVSAYSVREQADGKILLSGNFTQYSGITVTRLIRLNSDGTLDTGFTVGTGFSSSQFALDIAIQPDNKIMLVGNFTSYNGLVKYGTYSSPYISRLTSSGNVSTGFTIGSGFNGVTQVLKEQSDGKILVGGSFTSYTGISYARLIRLYPDSTIDTGFTIGTGFNNIPYDIKIQDDNKILIGGAFTTYSGISATRIIRLNYDGTIDTGFTAGTGFNSTVCSIDTQTDGKILVGGQFTTYSGYTRYNSYSLKYISSLTLSGNTNTGFTNNNFNSSVYTIDKQSDGKLIVGGAFTSVTGTTVYNIVRLNTDGTKDTSYSTVSGPNNIVYYVKIQPDNKILVGGTFTTYSGISNRYIARVNSDGTLDYTFNSGGTGFAGSNPYVYGIDLLSDNSIICVGQFTSYNGYGPNYIVKLSSGGTIDTTFLNNMGVGFNFSTYALKIQSDNKILVGGSFTSYSGVTRNRIIRLNSNGTIDTGFTIGNGFSVSGSIIYAIDLQSDGKILVGGNFTTYSGVTQNYITRLNTDGTRDTGFTIGTGFNDVVKTIKVLSDGKILIGGLFTQYNSTYVNRIVVLNTNGTIYSGFNSYTGYDNNVNTCIQQTNGSIVTGGDFLQYSGETINDLIRLNSNGSIDTGFTLGFGSNGVIYSVKYKNDGKILIGGSFTTYNGISRGCLAQLNTDGTLDSGFVTSSGFTGTSQYVRTLTIQSDDKILCGGDFTGYSGTSSSCLIRLNSNATIDTGFTVGAGFSSVVYSILYLSDGKLVVGGNFVSYSGVTSPYIIKLNSNGIIDTSFDYQIGYNSYVYSIMKISSTDDIVLGGNFTEYGGSYINYIIRLNTDGSVDTSLKLGNGFNGLNRTITLSGDSMFIGGNFTQYNNRTFNRLIKLNSVGDIDYSFDSKSGFNATVYTTALQNDGKLLVGGQFSSYSGVTQSGITRLNIDGTRDTGFTIGNGLGISGYANDIKIQTDGKILVGSNSTTYSGVSSQYYVRLNIDGTRDTGFTIGTGFNGDVISTYIQSDGKLLIVGAFTSYSAITFNRIVRLNSDGTPDYTFDSQIGFNSNASDVIKLSDGNFLVIGDFVTYGGTYPYNLVRLNSDGTLDTTFKSGINANTTIRVIKYNSSTNKILLGGSFTSYNSRPTKYIAQLNSDGILDTGFTTAYSFDNTIYDLNIQSDNKILVGGVFTNFSGSSQKYFAKLNSDGTKDTGFTIGTGFDSTVWCINKQSDNKILIGGDFTTYSGQTANRIIRLNSDGTIDTSFPYGTSGGSGLNSIVYSILLDTDNKIICGGGFTSYSGITFNRIVKLNTNGIVDKYFNSMNGYNSSIFTSLKLSDGNYMVGGLFTSVGGSTVVGLLRLNNDSSIDTTFKVGLNLSASGVVRHIIYKSDGKILIGGAFTTYNSQKYPNLVQLNSDGSIDHDFNTQNGFNTTVMGLALQDDNKIIAVGAFTSYSGVTQNYITRLSTNATIDTGFTIGTGFNTNALPWKPFLQPDGKILITGNFTTYSGVSQYFITRLNSNGSIDTGFTIGTGFSTVTNDLCLTSDNKIIVTGNYTTYSGYTQNKICKLKYDGSIDWSFDSQLGFNSSTFTALITSDNSILIGGQFNTYGGNNISKIIRLNTDGTLDTTFKTGNGLDNTVQSIKIKNDDIYVGGSFSVYNNRPSNCLVKLNSNGIINTGFTVGSGFNSTVNSVDLQSDGKILVGGNFTTYSGVTQNYITRLNTDGIRDTGFTIGNGFNSTVMTVKIQLDDKILVGGNFTTYSGATYNRIIRLNYNGTVDSSFSGGTGFNTYPYMISLQNDGKILTIGRFTSYNSVLQSYMSRLNTNGSIDSEFNMGTGLNAIGYCIGQLSSGKIFIGGSFTYYYYSADINRILKINSDGSIDNTFVADGGFNSTVRRIILESDNKILAAGNFNTYSGITQGYISKLLSNGTIDSSFTNGGFNANVNDIQKQSDNKILVGGSFTSYGGQSAYNYTTFGKILKLNSNGTIYSNFITGSGFNSIVKCFDIQSDGKIILGGSYTQYSGTTFYKIVRLNTDGTRDTGFTSGGFGPTSTSYMVYSLKVQTDGKIVCGGNFTTYSGVSYNRIVRLNSDGTIDTGFTVGNGFGNTVITIELQTDGKILCGGNFTTYSGITQNYITRLNSNGSIDTGFTTGTGFDSSVSVIKIQTDGKILCGGNFTTYSGITGSAYSIRLNSNGTRDTGFTYVTGFNNYVQDIKIQTDGKILVGGQFTTFSGASCPRIARLLSNGRRDTGFTIGTGFDSSVFCLNIQSDGKILVGGAFTTYNGYYQKSVVRLNTDGSIDYFNYENGLNIGALIYSIKQLSDNSVLMVGDFSYYGGSNMSYFVRLNSNGIVDTTLKTDSSFNNYIWSMCVQPDSKILLGGDFTIYSGQTVNRIIRLNSDGTIDSGFTTSSTFTNSVYDIRYQLDGKLLVGGNFTGTTYNYIVRLNTNGSIDTGFTQGTGFNAYVNDIKISSDGKIFVGGSFTTYSGITQSYFCKLNSNGTIDYSFNSGGTGFNASVNFIYLDSDDKLIISGNFTSYNGLPYYRIVRLNSDGTPDSQITTISDPYSAITYSVTGISRFSGLTSGYILSDLKSKVTEKGICYSTSSTPTISDNKVNFGSGSGFFSGYTTGLTLNTTYYVRSYAIINNTVVYGNIVSFSTLNISVGDVYAGGKVAYIYTPSDIGYESGKTKGFVVDPYALNTAIRWYNGSNVTTNATGSTIGTGSGNTYTIVGVQGDGSYAAKLTFDHSMSGYTDWYMGTTAECTILYTNKTTLGLYYGIASAMWTSQEVSSSNAYNMSWTNGSTNSVGKSNTYSVHAIRTFTYINGT